MKPSKKIYWALPLLGWSLMSLTGCLMTREDIAEEEQKKAVQQQVSTLQKTNAESQSRYSELNDDLRDLHGKIEALENKVHTQAKEQDKAAGQRDQQLAESNKKIAALQEEIQKLENQVNFLNQEMVKMSQAASASVAAPAEPVKGQKKSDIFKDAEELFAKKEWKSAIVHYEKYRESLPAGKKYPMATYKIGLCFQELGMRDEAKNFFEEVISKFPESPLAKQAKDRLKKKKE